MFTNSGFSLSVIGASHIRKNKLCQDNSAYLKGRNFEVITVSDGHGGTKHFRSEKGSFFATQVINESISDFVNSIKAGLSEKLMLKKVEEYEKSIICLWRQKVEMDYEANDFSCEELEPLTVLEKQEVLNDFNLAYGATFLCAIKIQRKIIIMQLGDGNCIVVNDDKVYEPLQEDERLKYGFTTSLCSQTAYSDFRHTYIDYDKKFSIFLTSDGVINSFENVESFYNFLRIVNDNTKTHNFLVDLNVFLSELSLRGSGDDMSIAAIYK